MLNKCSHTQRAVLDFQPHLIVFFMECHFLDCGNITKSLQREKRFCDTLRLRARWRKRRHQRRLPELSEQQTSQGRPKDGEAHSDNTVPEPELPGGHVMVQQEKRKHGHCTLLTCEHNNGTDKVRSDQGSGRFGTNGKWENGWKGNKREWVTICNQ